LTKTKVADVDFGRAIAAVEPFAKSHDEDIRDAAEAARVAYSAVLKADKDMIVLIEAMLNGESKQGTFLQRITDARALKVQAWQALVESAPLAAMASFEGDSTSNVPGEKRTRPTSQSGLLIYAAAELLQTEIATR
jgi:hypothetical protein